MNPPGMVENEEVILEIPPSRKTPGYYALKAAPLFGVWFIGLLAFLIYSYRVTHAPVQSLLFQALALSAFAYLVGTVARWLWRVDVSQRDAWLTTNGIWIQSPSGTRFIPYGQIARVREKADWMEHWLHLDEIEIQFMQEGVPKKMALVGVENGVEIVQRIREKLSPEARV